MFLPNYSGDGKGNYPSGATRTTVEPSGHVAVPGDGELPLWSGDGRRQVANPLMPVFQANHRSSNGTHRSQSGRTTPPQVLPVSGDGRRAVDVSSELSMTVNAPARTVNGQTAAVRKSKPARKRKSKRQVRKGGEVKSERSEMWKLVALVVIFLVWISTASTLLFLYMDRYLFP